MDYADKGCRFAPQCLRCPLPRCVEERFRGTQTFAREERDAEILRRFIGADKSPKELAAELGISRETVQRALRQFKGALA